MNKYYSRWLRENFKRRKNMKCKTYLHVADRDLIVSSRVRLNRIKYFLDTKGDQTQLVLLWVASHSEGLS